MRPNPAMELTGGARRDNPQLDGEYAEIALSRVVVALAAAGDDAFADALARQPVRVRKQLACHLALLWTRYKLTYPRTHALLQPNA